MKKLSIYKHFFSQRSYTFSSFLYRDFKSLIRFISSNKNVFLLSFLAVIVLFNYSCKKTELEKVTTFEGTVLTNGTEDIVLDNNGKMPSVAIYKIDKASLQEEKIASSVVNSKGEFQIQVVFDDYLDNFERDWYDEGLVLFYFDVIDLDYSKYYLFNGRHRCLSFEKNTLVAGEHKSLDIYVDGRSKVVFKLINTNTNNCASDHLNIGAGGGFYYQPGFGGFDVYGCGDSLFEDTLETFSGHMQFLTIDAGSYTHYVRGTFKSNGKTTSINVPYTAPPFVTSVIEIEY